MFPSTLISSEIITNSSKQDQDLILPFSYFNFPSPLFSLNYPEEEEEEEGGGGGETALLLHPFTDICPMVDTKTDVMEPGKQFADMNESGKIIVTEKVVSRKRSSKKDRHSKINTAQGLRARRMRLSLKVARKFFDLQDMLGFDKASKTVDWLLTQSKLAINDLSNSKGSECSPSECDMASGVIDESFDVYGDRGEKAEEDSKGFRSGSVLGKSRKTSSRPQGYGRITSAQLARESRERARARAKERTREKMLLRRLNSEESGTSQLGHNIDTKLLPSEEVRADIEEQLIVEDSFRISSNCLQSVGNFQENLFRDFQLIMKSWEAYNGNSYLC